MLVHILLLVLVGSLVTAQQPQTMVLYGIVRDQAPYTLKTSPGCRGQAGTANGGNGFPNTDFEILTSYVTGEKGLVKSQLGEDNTPVYNHPGMSPGSSIKSPSSFYTWFHNTNHTVNVPINITLSRVPNQNVYQYNSMAFFPIDGQGWKDSCSRPASDGKIHNFAFCFETHSRFVYTGGEVFTFNGDDDVWVFIDRKLVVDLGGLHPAMSQSISLDNLGLVIGNSYPFDFFYCERHTTESNLQITTSLAFFCAYYDWCGVCEGNGQSCCNNAICDDNNACTTDYCPIIVPPSPTSCVHKPITCPPAVDACSVSSCNALTGCSTQPVVCNDNNACTTDTCNNATGCVYRAVSCDDQDKCTIDSCNGNTGCMSTPVNCDDGNKCTIDSCDKANGCIRTPVTCDDRNSCTIDSCSPSLGCIFTPISCDDSNACTNDFCNSTTGCGHTPLQCDDQNKCTLDSCDAATGCKFSSISCNDNNACTVDSCNVATGCLFAAIQCNDNNACTTDSCNRTTGCLSTPIQCDDKNKCTIDTCDVSTGCKFSPIVCNDNNACTVDSCNGSTGCSFTPIQCNDNNACTVDSCNAATGCSFTPIQCDDRNACTTDTCDRLGGCKFSSVSCNDNNACTIDSCNVTSGCSNTPVQCDDRNACTTDTCDSVRGCQYSVVPCNDNNACTVDSCSSSIGCVHQARVCDDGNLCTIDACDIVTGCGYTNITCENSGVATCGSTSCNPMSGCQHSPIIDAKWEHNRLNSWVDHEKGLVTQFLAVLVTGKIPLFSVKFSIYPEVSGIFNALPNGDGLYSLPIWQYVNGLIPAHSSYVSFGYTIAGPNPANISLSSGICAPEYTGCNVQVSNLLVNSWIGEGVTVGQYNVRITNTGTKVIANVNMTITPPNGSLYSQWNFIQHQSVFQCQLWNLYPGETSQACGYNVNFASSVAPAFDVADISPLCI